MKRLLLLTRTTKVGGAEKIVAQIKSKLEKEQIPFTYTTLDERSSMWTALTGPFELIHSHLFLPGVIIGLRRFWDKRFVWVHTVHYGGYEAQRWARLKRLVDRYLVFRRVDRLIAVGHSVSAWLKLDPRLNSKVLTIRNGCPPLAPYLQRKSVGPLVIGTIAMLRSEKGLLDLIDAVALGHSQGKSLKLRIAGEGPQRSTLEKHISRLGLEKIVSLDGYVTELDSFFASIDVFACPSHIESFGIAVLEAMAHGTPVVAAAVGEIPFLLQDGKFGKLVPRGPMFKANLLEAILELASEREMYSLASRAGHEFHRESEDERLEKSYVQLYRQLTGPGVCMVSPIVTHATGGIQKQLLLQSRELTRRGYRVFVLQKKDPALLTKIEQWSHVDFIQTPTLPHWMTSRSKTLQRVDSVLFIFGGFFQLARRRHALSVVHAHQLFSPTLMGSLFKKIFHKKLVVKVTASGQYGEMNELRSLPFLRLRKYLFKEIDKLIVLTDDMKSEMLAFGFPPEKLALISNSVGIITPREQSVLSHPYRILFTGRISREKSLDTLIKAAILVAKTGMDCEVTFVGGTHGGRDHSTVLYDLASNLPSNLKINFLGHSLEIGQHYQSAHVFVLPSLSEGMSNSLLEAMAHGLACIVSDIPANRFVVNDGFDALTFHPSDANDLARQLLALAPGDPARDERRLQLGINARATVNSRFSIDSIGAQLVKLYDQRPQV